jgi:oligoribonuclease (3'-5' exoribonuclease)
LRYQKIERLALAVITVRVNLKLGSAGIVARLLGNVARLEDSVLRQVTGFFVAQWGSNVARWCAGSEKQKRIFGCRFVPNFKRYFYYKYRPCIRLTLEIEGAKTRV